jgi:hypothetical protein
MSIEEIFKRLIKMPIKNMIGYAALMAMIALIGFSIIKAFNPTGDSNRASQEALKKQEEALKVLDAATADRERREALGSK